MSRCAVAPGLIVHDPEKLVLDLTGDGNRFSEQIIQQTKRPQDGLNRVPAIH